MVSTIVSLQDGGQLYLYVVGRLVRITTFATSVEEANDYLSKHRGQSVISQTDGLILMADHEDQGKRVKL